MKKQKKNISAITRVGLSKLKTSHANIFSYQVLKKKAILRGLKNHLLSPKVLKGLSASAVRIKKQIFKDKTYLVPSFLQGN